MQDHPGEQDLSLGPYSERVAARLAAWSADDVGRRFWQKDGTIWIPDPEEAAATGDLTNRLDWIELPERMRSAIGGLAEFAGAVQAAGFRQAALLGMGGSSLAPEVLMTVFGSRPGFLPLSVIDTTVPAAVKAAADALDPQRTLFLVSSKSGGTLETLSLLEYFFGRTAAVRPDAGRSFVAITDPGSKLEALAREMGFYRVFSSPPGVGGRYSALTEFGLVPAALIGMDLGRLLDRAAVMAAAAGPGVPAESNPALVLGAALGELALAGRDKLTLLISPAIAHLGVWIEQLVAESTGKKGTGILPIPDEEPPSPENCGDDRLLVSLRLEGDDNALLDSSAAALAAAGHPMIRIALDDAYDLGAEFFRWEMATAAAGAVLGINPFDQPDVEAAKIKARELMDAFQSEGSLPSVDPVLCGDAFDVFGGAGVEAADAPAHLDAFLKLGRPGDYAALMVYAPMTEEIHARLNALRRAIRRRCGLATTLGYGPRFLHSTGQLHKGDGNKGLFIQITCETDEDVGIPGKAYTFGVLAAAQAQGDYQALVEGGRRVIRLHARNDLAKVLAGILEALDA
jgi:glucose-6-phosphate isomerase